MKKYKLTYKEYQGDVITPVSAYLSLRNLFADCRLLESADYNSNRNSSSILVFNNLSVVKIKDQLLRIIDSNDVSTEKMNKPLSFYLDGYLKSIKEEILNENNYNAPVLTGYMGYNAVQYVDSVQLDSQKEDTLNIPDVCFGFFEYVMVFDHFHHSIKFYHYTYEESKLTTDEIIQRLRIPIDAPLNFKANGLETEHATETEFLNGVDQAIHHCKIGNTFQLVLSRKFSQAYTGDEFAVYRSLRSINPSPYMFYFDEGNFKLFGSSPECHLRIADKKVSIHPIAGTIKRNGNDINDAERLNKLIHDPKENAEHDMLIDLARNDLSVYCKKVEVVKQKQVQQFSHVFHLVSEVEGTLQENGSIFDVLSKSFPAGTLSGTPKFKAIELIDELEKHQRDFYGGAIGFIDLQNNLNLAIIIRSVCAKENKLTYMAGAGVTVNSLPEHELKEVNNKIGAVRSAIELTNIKGN